VLIFRVTYLPKIRQNRVLIHSVDISVRRLQTTCAMLVAIVELFMLRKHPFHPR